MHGTKHLLVDNDIALQDGWQSAKKVITLKQRPMLSRHWDASSSLPGQPSTLSEGFVSKAWVHAIRKGIWLCDNGLNVFAALGDSRGNGGAMAET